MAKAYRSAADNEATGWPPGVPYIVVNEACERFSFYGMQALLKVYLGSLFVAQGLPPAEVRNRSTAVVHLFVAAVYLTPLLGAVVADRYLGKYPTVLGLSLLYCAGHGLLSLTEGDLQGTYAGLALIAVGAGGIKANVSAHVGDQFGAGNRHRLERVFQIFYFAINFGSFFATLLIPWTKERFGWTVAFAVPGVLMALATWVFWLGRHRFVHVPPRPGGRLGALDALSATAGMAALAVLIFGSGLGWLGRIAMALALVWLSMRVRGRRQRLQSERTVLDVLVARIGAWGQPDAWGGLRARFGPALVGDTQAMLHVVGVFASVSLFWGLWYQYASSWVDQASMMDRHLRVAGWSLTLLPEQVQAANPVLVMIFVPLLTAVGYPVAARLGLLREPLQRMGWGMVMAALSFVAVASLQVRLDAGHTVSVAWQLLPYSILTLAEVMIYATGLEFAYRQAPAQYKSTVMGLWMLTLALGNVLTGLIATLAALPLQAFFWLFAALMALAALAFLWRYGGVSGAARESCGR